MVFPGMTDPSHAIGQRPYEQCELLYQAAELPEERAYALGCFLHGSTDAVAHHYVNYMTGETFTLTPVTSNRASSLDNVVRHILAESQIQAAAIAQDPDAFADSKLLHTIPIGFVLRAYLDVDSPLWQMMAKHAKAEYDAVLAEDPGPRCPTIVAAMDVAPADHLVLSPVYLGSVDDLIVKKKLELEDRIATMQDWNSPEGSKLLVTPGDDGVLGTKDDDTDCSASCPELFATYFTFVGLLAPRYNAQNQELPSAFEKVSEELRKELFLFHEAYLEVVANLSAKLNAAPDGMSGEFGLTKEDARDPVPAAQRLGRQALDDRLRHARLRDDPRLDHRARHLHAGLRRRLRHRLDHQGRIRPDHSADQGRDQAGLHRAGPGLHRSAGRRDRGQEGADLQRVRRPPRRRRPP